MLDIDPKYTYLSDGQLRITCLHNVAVPIQIRGITHTQFIMLISPQLTLFQPLFSFSALLFLACEIPLRCLVFRTHR